MVPQWGVPRMEIKNIYIIDINIAFFFTVYYIMINVCWIFCEEALIAGLFH